MRLATVGALLLLGSTPLGGDPPKVDFATLAGFEYRPGEPLPTSVTRYHKETVTISGFMRREEGGDGKVENFMVVNDACGCQGTPKLNEIVFCAMLPGAPTEVLPGVVTATGTLYVEEQKDGDVVVALYTMDIDTLSGDG